MNRPVWNDLWGSMVRVHGATKAPFRRFDPPAGVLKLEGLFLGYSQAWWTTE